MKKSRNQNSRLSFQEKNTLFKKGIKNDYALLIGLILLSVISIYYLPNVISSVLFLVILVAMYRSKADYFWLVFLVFLVDPPGGLFPNRDYNYSVPLYLIPGLRYIYFPELVIFCLFAKFLLKKRKVPIYFKNSITLLAVYCVFLLVLSFFFGISPTRLFRTIRFIIPYTLLFSIPALMNSPLLWVKFYKLLFPIVFINLGTQLYELISGQQFAILFGTNFNPFDEQYGNYYEKLASGELSGVGSRVFYSYMMNISILLGSMYFSTIRQDYFSKRYLRYIMGVAIFSIVLTATRGYIVAISFAWVAFILYSSKNIMPIIQYTVSIVAVVIILLFAFPQVKDQFTFISSRLTTLDDFKEEDTARETGFERFTEYMPMQMVIFKESPIFGWAFSDKFHNNSNGHVGHTNMLINGGVIGYLLFVGFWFAFNIKLYRLYKTCSSANNYMKGLPVFIIIFFVFFIIHSTSGQVFHYMVGFESTGIVLLLYFSFAINAYNYTKLEENRIRQDLKTA